MVARLASRNGQQTGSFCPLAARRTDYPGSMNLQGIVRHLSEVGLYGCISKCRRKQYNQ
jgi:hypothetical protein